MGIWLTVFSENYVLRILLFVGMGVLLAAAFLGFITRSMGACTGLTVFALGGFGLFSAFFSTERQGKVSLCLLVVTGSILHLILLGALFLRKRVAERRIRRAEVERRLQYTLPDRENSFVRTRLNTTLYVQGEEEKGEFTPVRLKYAQELLCRVKNSPLTVAERLQTDEMESLLSVVIKKEKWTSGDVRCANELCARLLKLSAKYAV